MTPEPAQPLRRALRQRAAWLGFALAVLLQLAVLYAPSTPDGVPGIPGLDKLVHAGVFLLPALLGVLAGLGPWRLGIVLAAHAVVSELVQHLLLPQRSGDVLDVLADLAGVAAGLALGLVLHRLQSRRDRGGADA